ncbi:MAG: hypothetical protein ABIY40_04800 [Rhodanobacteraceae bacterium]
MKRSICLLRQLLPAVGLLGTFGGFAALPTAAHAGPAENIYTPIVDYREWELELKGGAQDWDNPNLGERAAKLAFGYGIAPRWGVEVEAEYSQTPNNVAHVEVLEFENIIQLTEHGEHWLDAGIIAEFDHNRLENRNTLEIGPMLQKEIGRSQFNLNVLWERRLSAAPAEGEDDEGDARSGLAYEAQWKWNLQPLFQPGMQVFATLGDPAHLHSDEFKAGPAFFGVARLGDGKSLRYNAALLGGMTHNTPDATFRFQLEYEFF